MATRPSRIVGQGNSQLGNFLGALNILLRASSAQHGLDITDLFLMEKRYVAHRGPNLPDPEGNKKIETTLKMQFVFGFGHFC